MLTTGRFRLLAAVTAISGYLQITLGGLVRVSGSGLGCPDWPTCYGQPYPPADLHAIIEYSHRANGALFGLLVILTLVAGLWLNGRRRTPLTWLTWATLATVLAEGLLGWQVVHTLLAPVLVMVHLALALIILGLMISIVIIAGPPAGISPATGLRRLAITAALLTYLMLVTGSSVVASHADDVCKSWPLCGSGFAFDFHGPAAYAMLHRLTVGAVSLLLLHVLSMALRRHRGNRQVRWVASLTLALLLIQVMLGAFVAVSADVALLQGSHLALATAVWAGVVALALLVGLPQTEPGREEPRIAALERRPA